MLTLFQREICLMRVLNNLLFVLGSLMSCRSFGWACSLVCLKQACFVFTVRLSVMHTWSIYLQMFSSSWITQGSCGFQVSVKLADLGRNTVFLLELSQVTEISFFFLLLGSMEPVHHIRSPNSRAVDYILRCLKSVRRVVIPLPPSHSVLRHVSVRR